MNIAVIGMVGIVNTSLEYNLKESKVPWTSILHEFMHLNTPK